MIQNSAQHFICHSTFTIKMEEGAYFLTQNKRFTAKLGGKLRRDVYCLKYTNLLLHSFQTQLSKLLGMRSIHINQFITTQSRKSTDFLFVNVLA